MHLRFLKKYIYSTVQYTVYTVYKPNVFLCHLWDWNSIFHTDLKDSITTINFADLNIELTYFTYLHTYILYKVHIYTHIYIQYTHVWSFKTENSNPLKCLNCHKIMSKLLEIIAMNETFIELYVFILYCMCSSNIDLFFVDSSLNLNVNISMPYICGHVFVAGPSWSSWPVNRREDRRVSPR